MKDCEENIDMKRKMLYLFTFIILILISFLSYNIQFAGVAQSAEQLICNQQVAGSSPITSSKERFPSGQRGQTVNLLAQPSEVRFLPSPPFKYFVLLVLELLFFLI